MGLAANLLNWQAEHPEEAEKARQDGRIAAANARRGKRSFHKPYPSDASYEERMAWYEQEFLTQFLSRKAPRKRDEWLKMAFMCVTKRGPGKGTEDPMELYAQELKRQIANREKGSNGEE